MQTYLEKLNVCDSALSLKLIDVPEGTATVTLPESVPAGGSVEGAVRLIGTPGSKGFEKSFTIQLDDPNASRFTVPLKLKAASAGQTAAEAGR